MPKLKLSDGTEFEGTAVITGYDMLVKVSPAIAQEHFFDFGDETKMDAVEYYFGFYKNIFHGYNKFGHLELDQPYGLAKIWMHGDKDSYIEKNIPAVPEEYIPKEQ